MYFQNAVSDSCSDNKLLVTECFGSCVYKSKGNQDKQGGKYFEEGKCSCVDKKIQLLQRLYISPCIRNKVNSDNLVMDV